MAQDEQTELSAPAQTRVDRVVHNIAGGEVVVETFSNGSVRVNGDLVTPGRELTLGKQDDARQ
jgi:hypothetical protein